VLLPVVFWCGTEVFFKPVSPKIGLGLAPKALDATAFIKYAGIQGPFFNNRDAAGAIIYSLYPGQHPFIDDRINGFSKEFVDKHYFPSLMQDDLRNWHQLKNKYAINAIYFKLESETNEKLAFLGDRLGDGEWALVYQNKNRDAILLRRNKMNMEIIKQYEINPADKG
jgi:hypothetical protein